MNEWVLLGMLCIIRYFGFIMISVLTNAMHFPTQSKDALKFNLKSAFPASLISKDLHYYFCIVCRYNFVRLSYCSFI